MSKKTTMHSGRAHADGTTYDPNHNDRKFDIRQADNMLSRILSGPKPSHIQSN